MIFKAKKLYTEGKNITSEFLKYNSKVEKSELIKIIYELQTGSYLKMYNKNKLSKKLYAKDLFFYMKPYLKNSISIMEAGIGEGTTTYELSKIIEKNFKKIRFLGFDLSLSRLLIAKKLLKFLKKKINLFNSDLKKIPLPDSSVDVIYTSHSLEPNRGYEKKIIKELLRVSKKYVILFEPIYELNSKKNQSRMRKFNYVRNLKKICQKLNCKINKYEKINYSENTLNETGVIVLKKMYSKNFKKIKYLCPNSMNELKLKNNFFINKSFGFMYPIYEKIPILLEKNYILNMYRD